MKTNLVVKKKIKEVDKPLTATDSKKVGFSQSQKSIKNEKKTLTTHAFFLIFLSLKVWVTGETFWVDLILMI